MNVCRRVAITAFAVGALAGCGRQGASTDAAPAPPSGTPAERSTGSLPSTTAGVIPHEPEAAASRDANGPGRGATAIGGVSGNPQNGGASTGGAPPPTGGDAAASAPR